MGRIIAIGDVHGELTLLRDLLDKISPVCDDTIIFLGDLIDRGPDSQGVVDAVLSLRRTMNVVAIKGNHEQMLLDACRDAHDFAFWLKFGGREAMISYGLTPPYTVRRAFEKNRIPPSHNTFFSGMEPWHETETHLFCHTQPLPKLEMANQPDAGLRWNQLDLRLPAHVSGKTVVCGHTSGPDVRKGNGVVCIDTGCGVQKDGYLTAYDVTNDVFFHSRPGESKSQETT